MPRLVIGVSGLAALVAVSLTAVFGVSGPVREAARIRPHVSPWSVFNSESQHVSAMRGALPRQRLHVPRPASWNERNVQANA